jgi:hypothetical protein
MYPFNNLGTLNTLVKLRKAYRSIEGSSRLKGYCHVVRIYSKKFSLLPYYFGANAGVSFGKFVKNRHI